MAIDPGSDLILDVARAVDPARRQATEARLRDYAARAGALDRAAVTFASGLPAGPDTSAAVPVAADYVPRDPASDLQRLQSPATGGRLEGGLTPFQQFEALLLGTMLDGMVSKKSPALFGKQAGSEVWRSMLVEQFATEFARAGGLGLAGSLVPRV